MYYEGYDERIKTLVTDEISPGDFVLTGGELAAMTIMNATVRLIPEVLGKRKLVIRMIVSHQGFWSFHSILAQLSFVA